VKRLTLLGLVLVLLLALVLPGAAAAAPAGATSGSAARTYTVLVGWENARRGVELNAYFPQVVSIHVGDTVRWMQQTKEIHTVTFLAQNQTAPDLVVPTATIVPALDGVTPGHSPLMLNPAAIDRQMPADGKWDGTGEVNSGLMGLATGQFRDFALTFTAAGTYSYFCLVHGQMMSGTVQVMAGSTWVPSPSEDAVRGAAERAGLLARVPGVLVDALRALKAPTRNADGSLHYYVMLGFGEGQVDLMRFFPAEMRARPGDTITWQYPAEADAPHTVTFLNRAAAPDLADPVMYNGTLYVLVNRNVVLPMQPGVPLTRSGIFSSGLLTPGGSFSLTVGDVYGRMDYVCLLHDEAGMVGRLFVTH
jgi:plastocyanin